MIACTGDDGTREVDDIKLKDHGDRYQVPWPPGHFSRPSIQLEDEELSTRRNYSTRKECPSAEPLPALNITYGANPYTNGGKLLRLPDFRDYAGCAISGIDRAEATKISDSSSGYHEVSIIPGETFCVFGPDETAFKSVKHL